jgi:hypothetical protein
MPPKSYEYTIVDLPQGYVLHTAGHPKDALPEDMWAEGAVVYCADDNSFYVRMNRNWTKILGRGANQLVLYFQGDW